jgi:hypothetical protein
MVCTSGFGLFKQNWKMKNATRSLRAGRLIDE